MSKVKEFKLNSFCKPWMRHRPAGPYSLLPALISKACIFDSISAYGVDSLHTFRKETSMVRGTYRLWTNICTNSDSISSGKPSFFQPDNAKSHTASITKVSLHRRERLLNWVANSLDQGSSTFFSPGTLV